MKGNEDISDRIEAYILKKLSPEEKNAFEKEMQGNPSLQKAVEAEKLMSSLLLEHELTSLSNQIQSDFSRFDKQSVIKKRIIGGLSILAIASSAIYIFNTSKKDTAETIPVEIINESKNSILIPAASESKISVISDDTEKPSVPDPKKATKANSTNVLPTEVAEETQPSNLEESNKSEIRTPVKTAEESVSTVVHHHTNSSDKVVVAPEPCDKSKIEANIVASPTQKGQNTGKIIIHSKQNRASHTLYSINKPHVFVKENYFDNLHAGDYELYVKSENGCVFSIGKTSVKETLCVDNYAKTFSPEYDPYWLVPLSPGENAAVIIKDKSGNTVFDSGSSKQEIIWTGDMPTGGHASSGVYKVFITYTSGEYCIASVTLFR